MGPIGIPEMIFILVIALLIFGPKRLPELGKTIGKALGEFRRATTDLKRSIDAEMTTAEPTSQVAPPRPTVARELADTSGDDDDDAEDDDAEPDGDESASN